MKNKQWVLGLTGGIGSGKTAVSNRLAELGATVIDTDEIAHFLTASQGEALPFIQKAFGKQAILPDGSMNRNHLRELIFEAPEQKAKLENILHPLIQHHVQLRLAQDTPNYFVLVVPLLFEKQGWEQLVNETVVVDCAADLQLARVIARNGWANAQVQAVMKHQMSREERLRRADHVIENNGDLSELISKIDFLHQKITKKVQK